MNKLAAAIIGGATVAAAMITGAQIQDGSIWQSDMAPAVDQVYKTTYNNTVGFPALRPEVASELGYGKSGETISIPAKTVTNVGGPFAANATTIATFKLGKGTWQLPVSARFDRTETGPADGNRPQLAIRYGDGKDAGTVMGSELSGLKGRELTGSDIKTVKLTGETTFTVYGFGYNDDQSANGGGTYTAGAELTPVLVNG